MVALTTTGERADKTIEVIHARTKTTEARSHRRDSGALIWLMPLLLILLLFLQGR